MNAPAKSCSCCESRPSQHKGDVCGPCAADINREKTSARRKFAKRPPCLACAAMLPGFEVETRCQPCQDYYEELMRAAEARVAKAHRRERNAAWIERRLSLLAARRRRHRLTLSEADIWRCTGRGVASCGGAL